MNLNDWLEKGWLVKHRPDRREIRELLGIADRATSDAEVKGISPDARLNIAHPQCSFAASHCRFSCYRLPGRA
jgi:hypothetical protein